MRRQMLEKIIEETADRWMTLGVIIGSIGGFGVGWIFARFVG